MEETKEIPIENVNKNKKDVQYNKNPDYERKNTIFSKSLISRKIILPINSIGKNINKTIEEYILNNYEGKCHKEGYIKPKSSIIISYSSGVISGGNNIVLDVVFNCLVCYPVEGMTISCKVLNITKAGIRAESSTDIPSPILVYISREHQRNNKMFNNINEGDIINVKIIGQRFELNDKYISIIGEIKK